ncbi:putative DNA (cytosine-5)-methyltransferase CMT1 isoform X1 [Trifolium pratense]|uniref:putative DNA (cytosine-5)-methyltransferase CMT1 isoform X1 n=1 Tax=Trifolium pratense TaxID=57577 RepID=UPI001E6974DA|nr:putative DNA (cytosine-5)-methyltransferase CMT1 isoform X1 [Trifolium pratense]XP_045828598.1 putative DNA (cytosine-5)-methyltransferase CMT1 isoform X1 [Trifolium pratense]
MAAAVSVVVAVAVKTVVAPELGFELRADPADSKAAVEMRLSHMNNSTVISLIKSMNYLALRTIKAKALKNSAVLSISGIKLVTRWAIYIIEYACESLKLNHPETQVRNESTENFLNLIKEWEKLCDEFVFKPPESAESDEEADDEEPKNQSDSEEFEMERFLSVCYDNPNEAKKPGTRTVL